MSVQKQTWTLITREQDLQIGAPLLFEGDEFHYAAHVLRLQVGHAVCVVNGLGTKAHGEVTHISKKNVTVTLNHVTHATFPAPHIHVCLALPKPSVLEDVVFQCSEMGVFAVHLFPGDKSAFKGAPKQEKLERASCEALRVSQSAFCTRIFTYESLEHFYELHLSDNKTQSMTFFCDESHVYANTAGVSLVQHITQHVSHPPREINLLLGPEASFSERERAFILAQTNCTAVSLGKNILRVPTAVCVAVGAVLCSVTTSIYS